MNPPKHMEREIQNLDWERHVYTSKTGLLDEVQTLVECFVHQYDGEEVLKNLPEQVPPGKEGPARSVTRQRKHGGSLLML